MAAGSSGATSLRRCAGRVSRCGRRGRIRRRGSASGRGSRSREPTWSCGPTSTGRSAALRRGGRRHLRHDPVPARALGARRAPRACLLPAAASLTDRVVTVSSFSVTASSRTCTSSADRVSAIALPEDPASSDRIRHLRAARPGRAARPVRRSVRAAQEPRAARARVRADRAGQERWPAGAPRRDRRRGGGAVAVTANVAADVRRARSPPAARARGAAGHGVGGRAAVSRGGLRAAGPGGARAGIPVAAARAGALPEVAAGRAELFDPYDLDDIARAIDVAASTGTDRRFDHSAGTDSAPRATRGVPRRGRAAVEEA